MVQPILSFVVENLGRMNKEHYKKGRSVLTAKVIRKDISLRVEGLEKIPAEALLRMALEQIGEQESYIWELEDKIALFESQRKKIRCEEKSKLYMEIDREAILEARKSEYYQTLEKKLAKQADTLLRLYAIRDDLIVDNNRLRKEHEKKLYE